MAPAETHRIPRIAAESEVPDLHSRLEHLWEPTHGLRSWLTTVDHKKLGVLYLITAFAFLLIGGVEALVLRIQISSAGMTVLEPEAYNQLFTMHGITMIFLYAVPILTGFSVYFWPLLLGARDLAFPRLNAFTYWTYLLSGLFLYSTFPFGLAPNDGWFNYVPQSALPWNPGPGIDVFALGMVFLGISTTASSINFIVTLARMRAPGMSLNRMPIFVWGTLTISVGNLFMIPPVSLAFFLLWLDRRFGTSFYDGPEGQPLLWQHLFWIFGHPWVYAIVLPAMGIVSDALPVFSRRPLVGYLPVAISTVATMMIGFGVWSHHMFATGLSVMALSFISGASVAISLPSAVAVFAWIATIWIGRPVFTTAFHYFAGFVLLFVMGGVSGFMTGATPFDWQLHDTYFVVAHLHYVLIGINLFAVIGGFYYWLPKITGRLLNERLGKWGFWTSFIGFNIAFFPMHIVGMMGMPRRIYTYPDGLGWEWPNLITTIGSYLFALGILLFLINVGLSLRRGRPAGDNPWDAHSLEWATSSPPPPYNFAVIPVVASRHPLWEERLQEGTDRSMIHRGPVLDRGKEAFGTSVLDGEPDVILKMPHESFAPLALSLALTAFFAGLLLFWEWLAVAGGVGVLVCTVWWVWPRVELGQRV